MYHKAACRNDFTINKPYVNIYYEDQTKININFEYLVSTFKIKLQTLEGINIDNYKLQFKMLIYLIRIL